MEDLEVTPAEQGKLKATVSFMLPTTTVDGKPLSKVDGVIIKRNGVKVATLGAGKPYQTITYEDNDVPSNGYHSYRVTALLDGEEGSKASRSAYIGLDIPLSPEGVKLLDNGNNVLAQWPEARNYSANKGLCRSLTGHGVALRDDQDDLRYEHRRPRSHERPGRDRDDPAY